MSSKTRPSRQEINTLQLVGSIENLSELWEALGFHLNIRPSTSHSSLLDQGLANTKTDRETDANADANADEKNADANAEKNAEKNADEKNADEKNANANADEEEVASTDESEEQRRLWTKHIFVDISSDGKFLVLASQKEIAILTGKWKNERLIFTKLWDGILAEATSSEVLTCCTAIPLRSKQRSSDGLPDWTCIVYGFKSGFVAFHTERGYSVHRQQFHLQSVIAVKLRSVAGIDHEQELVILYQGGIIVIVSGMDLYASLQMFKQHAAEAVSKGSLEDDLIETQSIPHEKFRCDSRQTVHDAISLGVSRISGFDQLLNAAVLGGREAIVKPPLPTFRRFILVGSSPLCASYFALEGETSLVLGQVAKAVASKVTTALTSRITATANRFGLQTFLGRSGGTTKEAEKKQKTLPKNATNVQPRYSLFDARRVATSIVLSANSRIAAITDNFGRVFLLDCSSGLIVRMWKGYRAAEVAWITLIDNRSSEMPKKLVECVVIYAPRRHLLEVWAALSGRRLVALRVSQGLRLLPLGADIVAHKTSFGEDNLSHHSQCYFLDLSGNLFTLNIPFYLVEEGGEEMDGHDVHTLQELKEFVITGRNSVGKKTSIRDIFESIESFEVKDEAVEFLLSYEAGKIIPTDIAKILKSEIAKLSVIPSEELTESIRLINRTWTEKLLLINWLESLRTNNDVPAGSVEEDDASHIDSALQDLNSGTLFLLIRSVTTARSSSPLPALDLNISLKLFLELFERIPDVISENVTFKLLTFRLNEEMTREQRLQCSLLLFSPYFLRKITFEEMKRNLNLNLNLNSNLNLNFRLERKQVTHLLLLGWMERNEEIGGCSSGSLVLLERILRDLLEDLQPDDLKEYRLLMQCSTNIPAAIVACLAVLSSGFKGLAQNSLAQSSLAQSSLAQNSLAQSSLAQNSLAQSSMAQSSLAQNSLAQSSLAQNSLAQSSLAQNSLAQSSMAQSSLAQNSLAQSSLAQNSLAQSSMAQSSLAQNSLAQSSLAQNSLAQSTDSEEWESICKEKLEWTRLSHRLESLLSLQNFLIRFMQPNMSFVDAASVSVDDFLLRGRSSAAEYLADWCSKGFLDIPPTIVMKAFYSTDIEIKLPSMESEDKDDRPLRFLNIPEISMENKEVSEALAVLKAIFPRSLTADVLLSNCCFELAVLWNKSPDDMSLLTRSLSYLSDVVDTRIIHGISLVIWKTFLCEKLSACAGLMEKVGKAPKERLFARDVNMSDSSVVAFFELTGTFLTLIGDTDHNRLDKFVLETEDLWYNEEVASKSSVVEMAVAQPSTTFPLVRHHMILVTVLHAIMLYSLKSAKPISLFDHKAREAFFKDLSGHPVLAALDLDQNIAKNRNQFLLRVVTAIVKTAADHCVHPDVVWIEKILEVADYWMIPGDEVRTLYVIELYSHGLDELGAEVYKTVTDKQPLLQRLFLLAGQRLSYLTSSTQNQNQYAKHFSTMSPTLASWIRSMDSTDLASDNVDWEQCYLLVRNISHDLNRSHAHYKMCAEVLEWIQHYVLAR